MVAVDRNTHGVDLETINQMMLDWEPSQHCVTVEDVNEAAKAVKLLQANMRAVGWVGFAIGSVVGSFIVALAWLVSP